jgi:hypothetical protein
MNYVLGKRILNILNHMIFPAKKQIDVSVFMLDLRMLNDLAYDVKIMTSQQRLSIIVTSTFL